MNKIIARLKVHDRWLFNLVVFHLLLVLVTIPGVFLDSRLVTGVNPWIKPIKFDISVVIYASTMAWVLQYLSLDDAKKIGRRIAMCLLIEIVLIYLQAARGVPSHFNIANPFDGIVFSLMGLFIAYNTYLIFKTLRLFSKSKALIEEAALRLSSQYGLISLLVGSLMGGYMSSRRGHSVGGPDGGPGIPLLNWSTQFGDLRVAHFVGLHGIQIFLVLGYLLYVNREKLTPARQRVVLHLSFAVFTIFNVALFMQALLGAPLF